MASALYSRLFTDTLHDGLVARNPCSRRTSPGMGQQRPYVETMMCSRER